MKKIYASIIYILFPFILLCQTISLTYDASGNRITKQFNSTLPVAVVTGDSLICATDIAQLNAAGGVSYLWSTGATQNNISVVGDTTMSYWVKVTNNVGCSDTGFWLLKVVPIPVTGTVVGASVVNKNQSLTYSVASDSGSYYNWTVTNGIIMSGYGTDSIVVNWDGSDTIGTITVYVTANNGLCTGNTSTKTVYVTQPSGIITKGLSYFSVFPNPSDENVFIKLGNIEPTPLLITIANDLGQITNQINLQSPESNFSLTLNKTDFGAAGIYTISIKTNSTVINKTEIITK